ncbi:unnamed protein product [Fusarium graminearum]|uniref:Chromosome 3, complete genome n=1 Tax=Gibberella zeae (strain ATCC MYA-4620 / CBS 123657 / FGSC 9075 / NRRL 31084 / PH-1) TaxID=229533 RepID=A0A098E0K9_GIBZE|nr:unnamed protein product [Fusarium graminearum]CZS85186.1 unnamed protein product [Fusarium graminearum]
MTYPVKYTSLPTAGFFHSYGELDNSARSIHSNVKCCCTDNSIIGSYKIPLFTPKLTLDREIIMASVRIRY